MAQYDVAVIGLGAAGSAALRELARRGVRVAGFEQFTPGHDRGSSHGETRMIRLGYFEHPSYVPLLRRTYELWRALEHESGEPLLRVTGIVEIGPSEGEIVSGTLRASREHALPHDVMSASETMRRFPAFRIPDSFAGVFQPDGGYVAVESSLAAMLKSAQAGGAEIRDGEAVRSIAPTSSGVAIETDGGSHRADVAVVAAGAWTKTLLPELPVALRPTRQAMAWFEPTDATPFPPAQFPVFLLESRHGVHYGFPLDGRGRVKIARHHHADETTDPERIDRRFSAGDEALIRSAIADHLPAANGALESGKTCLYTMTRGGDFVIDRLPAAKNVIVASACSGHGFKFAPVLGEILAQLAIDGRTPHDISRFSLARFG
jgi:sarcosine oxidase